MTTGLPQSTEKILVEAKNTLRIAHDYADTLQTFGISDAFLTQMQTDIESAEALPTEAMNRVDLKLMTGSKDDILDDCYLWGRQLKLRLDLAFGKRSEQTKLLSGTDLSNAGKSEVQMTSLMELMVKLANQYQTELADVGQTPEILEQGTTLLNSLRTADSDQELKKKTKRLETSERHDVFYQLYDAVNRINRIGRMVFTGDESKRLLFMSPWTRRPPSPAEAG